MVPIEVDNLPPCSLFAMFLPLGWKGPFLLFFCTFWSEMIFLI